MAPKKKLSIHPHEEQLLARLKQTTQRIAQEYQEKQRCVKCAEEIVRRVGVRPL
jgi:hypothetical protein